RAGDGYGPFNHHLGRGSPGLVGPGRAGDRQPRPRSGPSGRHHPAARRLLLPLADGAGAAPHHQGVEAAWLRAGDATRAAGRRAPGHTDTTTQADTDRHADTDTYGHAHACANGYAYSYTVDRRRTTIWMAPCGRVVTLGSGTMRWPGTNSKVTRCASVA